MLASDLNPRKLSIELLSGVIDHNKNAIRSKDLVAIEKAVQAEVAQIKKHYENEERLEKVVHALKDNNLPVTKKSVDKVMASLEKRDQIKDTLDKKWPNILQTDKALTLKQAYKAVNTPVTKEVALPLTESELSEMVTKHIKSMDLDLPEGTSAAKVETLAMRMVRQGIPISKANLEFAIAPSKALEEISESQVIDAMVQKIINKEAVEDVLVIKDRALDQVVDGKKDYRLDDVSVKSLSDKVLRDNASELISKISHVTTKDVAVASLRYKSLNLSQVFEVAEESYIENPNEDIAAKSINMELNYTKKMETLVVRHRQMEEIRLKMTMEAAIKLEIKGVKIETEPLEKVVDYLKEQESQAMKALAQVHNVSTDTNTITMATETITSYQYLKMNVESASSYVSISSEMSSSVTIKQMSLSYETSETKIRSDLGDRIEKTFDQIKPMLESLGIEPTKEAQVAAEILARNEMPITHENLLEIQMVQGKVDYVTKKMNPHLVLEMVKMGITPLDLSLDETIEIIEQFEVKFGETETEKIGRLIATLEKDGAITAEQKESLMGIYRTFDTVVRSKGGAATGFFGEE